MAIYRYSPKERDCYGPIATNSVLLRGDEAAWNLAYISWDFEKYPTWNDPYFSSNVYKTMKFVIDTGHIDDLGEVSPERKIRSIFANCPPAQAVVRICQMPNIKQTPMYIAYGDTWLKRIEQRARIFKEPDDEIHDFLVEDCGQACNILNTFRLKTTNHSLKETKSKQSTLTKCPVCKAQLNPRNLSRHLNKIHSKKIKNGSLKDIGNKLDYDKSPVLCVCGARVIFSNFLEHQRNGHSLHHQLIDSYVHLTPDDSNKSVSIRALCGGGTGLGRK